MIKSVGGKLRRTKKMASRCSAIFLPPYQPPLNLAFPSRGEVEQIPAEYAGCAVTDEVESSPLTPQRQSTGGRWPSGGEAYLLDTSSVTLVTASPQGEALGWAKTRQQPGPREQTRKFRRRAQNISLRGAAAVCGKNKESILIGNEPPTLGGGWFSYCLQTEYSCYSERN